ncbi:MAG: hypothetical protein KAS48_02395, partial [Gammaproteobacteria bacterium]|nr:hypothetical protein [Gammaproteobacteria bacterium]
MKKNCSYLIFYLVLVIPIIVLIMPASAWSATFNVATVSDLENALTAAQQNGEDDTIIVAAGTYDVSGGTLTYVASSVGAGENFALTIEGAGTGQTVIDGGNAAQCLSILTSTGVFDDSAAPITIRDISFQNGAASNNGGGANIRTLNASITIENSVFDSNDSNVGNSDGGGLSVRTWGTGTIMISGITASNNVSG